MASQSLRPLITRRNFIAGIGLLSASAALAACSSSPQSKSSSPTGPLLAIIHTNGTHGHDVAVEASGDTKGNFSMAAVAALKDEWKQKGYDVVLVDAGDATQGMPIVDTAKGSSAIAFMNACGYDLMTMGNHDFDWGAEALEANEKAANFPFLSANTIDRQTGKLRFAPNKVVTLSDGTKEGIFGSRRLLLPRPRIRRTARLSNSKRTTSSINVHSNRLMNCEIRAAISWFAWGIWVTERPMAARVASCLLA